MRGSAENENCNSVFFLFFVVFFFNVLVMPFEHEKKSFKSYIPVNFI